MIQDQTVKLRPALDSEKDLLWRLIYKTHDWKQTDAPYYPLTEETLEDFDKGMFQRFKVGKDALVIEHEQNIVGAVTSYWEDKNTRWLEIGITLYASSTWGKHIGRKALTLWISHLFRQHDIERLGLTTWSGNPAMIACAEALGLQTEGRLRKVRYYEGTYYDAIKMGVLREEWNRREREQSC